MLVINLKKNEKSVDNSTTEAGVADSKKRKIECKDSVMANQNSKGCLKTDDNDSDIELLGKVKHVSYDFI